MEDLKPCPFCGGEARASCESGKFDYFKIGCKDIKCLSYFWGVHCRKCGVGARYYRQLISVDEDSGKVILYEDGREKAIEAWNRRTADARDE